MEQRFPRLPVLEEIRVEFKENIVIRANTMNRKQDFLRLEGCEGHCLVKDCDVEYE
jgi:hypothetical protein